MGRKLLTPADQAFLAATLSLDEKRDKAAILAAWESANEAAAASMSPKQIWYRIAALRRRDEAKDYVAGLRATAQAALGVGVAEQTKAVFEKSAALVRLEQAMIEGLSDILENPEETGAARAKAAEAAVKVLGRQPQRRQVDPAIVAGRAARKQQLEAQKAARGTPNGGGNAPATFPMREGHIGTA